MKRLQSIFPIYLFVLAFALQYTHAQETTEVSKLERFYYDKCLKNTGTEAPFTKLRTDVYEMYKYFEYAFQFLPNQRKTFCKEQRSNLITRIKEIENDLKPCLEPREKFFAEFVKESFTEVLHFFCHNDGEYTTRFFNSQGAQCKADLEKSLDNNLDNCFNRIFAPTKRFITKSEICDDLTVAKKCFNQILETSCPNYNDYILLNNKFFSYVGKPCSSCIHFISGFVLLGSVLIHLFINKF